MGAARLTVKRSRRLPSDQGSGRIWPPINGAHGRYCAGSGGQAQDGSIDPVTLQAAGGEQTLQHLKRNNHFARLAAFGPTDGRVAA
jgi:hypothetical protein